MPWVYFSYGPFGPAKVQGRFDVIIVTNYLSGRLDLINIDVVLFSYHSFITFNIEKIPNVLYLHQKIKSSFS